MDTNTTIALLAMIFAGVTMLIYLGQLFVLILIYLKVIKEADQNARERQSAIEKAGNDWLKTGKYIEENLNKTAQRNMWGMAAIGILSAILLFGATKKKEK